ncbi:MAG: methyltransferase domain-containing protein [Anaerolineae bacterium]|jgi:SAM-dependent methyltransferase
MREDFYAEYYEIENVHWWFVARWQIFLEVIRREFDQESEIRALDAGCGTGTMLGHLEQLGPAVGIDRATAAVRFCRGRGRNRLVQGTADTLPLEDGTFDLVCALDMLEHIADDVAALKEMSRVCRPGGRILITVPAFQFLWGRQDEISHHLRRYTARELRARITAAGLEVRKLTYFNTLLFPIVAAIRVGRRLLPSGPEEEIESDFTMTRPGRLNDLLARVFKAESGLIQAARLPFGVSLLAVARKPAADA